MGGGVVEGPVTRGAADAAAGAALETARFGGRVVSTVSSPITRAAEASTRSSGVPRRGRRAISAGGAAAAPVSGRRVVSWERGGDGTAGEGTVIGWGRGDGARATVGARATGGNGAAAGGVAAG